MAAQAASSAKKTWPPDSSAIAIPARTTVTITITTVIVLEPPVVAIAEPWQTVAGSASRGRRRTLVGRDGIPRAQRRRLRPARWLDAVRGRHLQGPRGRARGARRRERDRQIDAAAADCGTGDPDRGLDPRRRPHRADAAVHRLGQGADDGSRLPPRVLRAARRRGGRSGREGGAVDARPRRRGRADALRRGAHALGG